MNLVSKLNASSRQLKTLGVLMVILVGALIYNYSSSSTPVPMTPTVPPVGANPVPLKSMPVTPASMPAGATRKQISRVEDFRPSLKLKEGTDVTKIDPTLRLDLLAKIKGAEMKGGTRSLFAFGAAPPPPVDPIKVGPITAQMGPKLPTPAVAAPKPGPPPAPAAPPIPLKFYGYSARGGTKRAFFLDGDEIQVAGENETIRNRYKVIRIGINSVVVEDTQSKHQQTLPLVEEMAG